MLPKPESDLWEAYLAAERRGIRNDRIAVLRRFLDSFSNLMVDLQRGWVLHLASKIVDDGDLTPIRMPLFRRALLLHLRAAIADEVPNSARWLASLSQHFGNCGDLLPELVGGKFTEHGLLLTALQHDPNDELSRHQLVKLLVLRLRYSLHELPAGVLFGADGASIAECAKLLSEVDDLVRHANYLDVADDYVHLVNDCRFHFCQYASYLVNGSEASCYADFLSKVTDV